MYGLTADIAKSTRLDPKEKGPQIMLEPDAAQAIAVTLHELATNAAIYAGWRRVVQSRRNLRERELVAVSWNK
jgi:two-component sensor histidine kinase